MALPGRAFTDDEWNELLTDFPHVGARDQFRVTGPETDVYNCLAWSMGITNNWVECPDSLADFVALYNAEGFEVCTAAQATVDGYGKADNDMTHGARLSGGHWSSKFGEWLLAVHPRDGIAHQDNLYGTVRVYFRPRAIATIASASSTPGVPASGGSGISTTGASGLVSASEPTASGGSGGAVATGDIEDSKTKITQALWSDSEVNEAATKINGLVRQSNEAFPRLADNFEKNFLAWKDSWKRKDPKVYLSSKSIVFAKGPEWDALAKMGPSILPQVVAKLQDSSNIFACHLYNNLQKDPKKKVDPKNLLQYYNLNNQAKNIIKIYGGNFVAEFEKAVADWEVHQETKKKSSRSSDYTSGDAYNTLVGMGKSALPLIMHSYSQDRTGWWHEILHEIEYGKKSGAAVFSKPALYLEWSNHFQGANNAAPLLSESND